MASPAIDFLFEFAIIQFLKLIRVQSLRLARWSTEVGEQNVKEDYDICQVWPVVR
jgi:hypothetical protein